MKKRIYIALAVLTLTVAALAGCMPPGQEQDKEEEETTIGNSAYLEPFMLSIAADNSVYQADEAIICHAILTHLGEEPITIYHSDPLAVFFIEGGPFKGEWARQDSLNRTTFEPEQEITVLFAKSGGWSADDEKAAFFETFYAEETLRLPPGDYTLSVQIAFATDENDMRGTMQTLTSSIDITVEE